LKLKGTIVHEDLGPGVFLLEADDGERYMLAGGDEALRKPGARVELDGEVVAGAGIAVQGAVFKVKSYKAC
jgi:hypothetical protein